MPWRGRVLEQVSQVVLDMKMDRRRGLHSSILRSLESLFRKEGWSTQREFEVFFDTYVKSRQEWEKGTRGFIDLAAVRDTDEIVSIEFDNTNVLKHRSIEKIIQRRGLAIGITAGRKDVDNKERVEEVMSELNRQLCNDFWLIEINQNRIRCFLREGKPVYEEWYLDSAGSLQRI